MDSGKIAPGTKYLCGICGESDAATWTTEKAVAGCPFKLLKQGKDQKTWKTVVLCQKVGSIEIGAKISAKSTKRGPSTNRVLVCPFCSVGQSLVFKWSRDMKRHFESSHSENAGSATYSDVLELAKLRPNEKEFLAELEEKQNKKGR